MSDYIKREDAIMIMACEMFAESQAQGFPIDDVSAFMPEAKAWMNDAPSADVVERKRGEWMIGENENDGWCKCSCCGYVNVTCEVYSICGVFNFCPNCGARMVDDDTRSNE